MRAMGSGHAKAYRGLQTAWLLAMGVLLVWQACLTGQASLLRQWRQAPATYLSTSYVGSAVKVMHD